MPAILKIPFLFFFIAAAIGVLLRWHHYQPLELNYPYWLHAHSHLMFLGWVFNALIISFVLKFIPLERHRYYKGFIVGLSLLVAGMLISFPLQGYGAYSIIISTLHTLVAVVFIFWFYRDTKSSSENHPVAFARFALLFFVISSIGPFVLGALVANGLGHTMWYNLSVYYYLHFQYNGVFMFGVIALFYALLEQKQIAFYGVDAGKFRLWLFVSCFPAYILSALWTKPGLGWNVLGFLAAAAQLVSLVYFIRSWWAPVRGQWKKSFDFISRMLLVVVLLCLVLKLVLQLISAIPTVAAIALDVRMYVIAYLHLVVIGIISFFLIVWYKEQQWITISLQPFALFILGFIGSEGAMIATGFFTPALLNKVILISSIMLVTGLGWVLLVQKRRTIP